MLKLINTQEDLAQFQQSPARERLFMLIEKMSAAVTGVKTPESTSNLEALRLITVFDKLDHLLQEVTLVEEKQRFGNTAFREWHKQAQPIFDEYEGELREYLSLAWGNPQRLDYGTGHELNFVAFLGGIIQTFNAGDILKVWDSYYKVSRAIILRYRLEPAGSHGVWGLDDHYHMCYILGAAQIKTDVDAPEPKGILDKRTVEEWCNINLYFSAIKFINTVKHGPFFEHSPLLFDASAAANWTKINKGMIRMYADNVLGKFPVVQHFMFGNMYKLRPDS